TVLVTATLLLGCNGDSMPPHTPGSVVVTVTTTGDDVDADGYSITLGSQERSVQASGSTTLDGPEAGSYDVTVGAAAANCSVGGDATRSVTVSEAQSTSVSFEVECQFDGAGAALPETTCSALSLAAVEGMPLDVISIGGVPEHFERPILARMSWSGGA